MLSSEQPEAKGEKEDLVANRFITSVRNAEVYRQVADEFGIELAILAGAGEKYDYPGADAARRAAAVAWSSRPLEQIMQLQGIVPKDSVYIQLKYKPTQDLGPFYQRAEQIFTGKTP